MGCLARVGCLTILVLAAAVGWLTRDRWMPAFHVTRSAAVAPKGPLWEPLTASGAERAQAALERLGRPTGPVFANLSGGDAASYMVRRLAKQLPTSADSVEAAVIDDRLCLRASVRPKDLGGTAALGPLAGFLQDRERMQFCGTFDVIRSGLSEYRVKEIRVRDFAVPEGAIPNLLQRVEHGARPSGVAPDGLPFEIPLYLGDIRVSNGKVTLYKAT